MSFKNYTIVLNKKKCLEVKTIETKVLNKNLGSSDNNKIKNIWNRIQELVALVQKLEVTVLLEILVIKTLYQLEEQNQQVIERSIQKMMQLIKAKVKKQLEIL